LIFVEELADVTSAHTRVDSQQAGLAIIIPEGFSDALTDQQATATMELYKDPTLTLGPSIVETLVTSILDGFLSNKITVGVAMEQFTQTGGTIDQEVIQDIMQLSSTLMSSGFNGTGSSAQVASVKIFEVSSGRQSGMLAGILGTILTGMAVFYMFFTAAATMQSILVEDEKGTLPRLFTTPTPRNTILNGKTLAVFVILIIQIAVLIIFGRFIFNIYWGEPLPLAVSTICVIILAGAAGLFILSWLQNTRQAGFVFGGVLTITGMLGMVTIFTGGPGTASPAVERASLMVPQGWAIRAFQLTMGGGELIDLLPTLGGILVWALVLGAIGQYRLRRRYT
jgi:ABC-2 type transport system permease protein